MRRESGFLGLLAVIFICAREGFGTRRAWVIMLSILLVLALPLALIALIAWLLS